MSQELATGTSLEKALLIGGYKNQPMKVDPLHCQIVLLGRQGSGKSNLLLSSPDIAVINADCVATSHSTCPATVIPGKTSKGTLVVPNPSDPSDPEKGIPVTMSWELLLQIKDAFISRAKSNDPSRPSLIALDTVDTAYPLLQKWMVDQHNARHPNNWKERFTDLDGRKAWGESYELMAAYGRDLLNAGYGFCWVCHLGDKYISVDDKGTKKIVENEPLIKDNLYAMISNKAEIVAAMTRTSEKELATDPVTKKKSFNVVTRYEMSFVSLTEKVEMKKKDSMPAILELPQDNPWEVFANAYEGESS